MTFAGGVRNAGRGAVRGGMRVDRGAVVHFAVRVVAIARRGAAFAGAVAVADATGFARDVAGTADFATPAVSRAVDFDDRPVRRPRAAPREPTDAPVSDALTRVAPALGARGEAITTVLARLRSANGNTRTIAMRDVENALDALERSAPADLQPDLAALRLNVEAMTAATNNNHP